MRRMVIAMCLCLLPACLGCGEDDKSSKVIGLWHFHGEDVLGQPKEIFVDITKTQITITDMPTVDIAMSTKDDKVVLRHAGKDEVFLVVGVIDDNTLEIDFGYFYGGRQRLNRINAAERDSIIARAGAGETAGEIPEDVEEDEEEPTVSRAFSVYSMSQMTYMNTKADALVEPAQDKKKYCDNFRNLRYGLKSGWGSVPQEIADAFAGPPPHTPTVGDAPGTAVPYGGYLFLDDPAVTDWDESFGLVAYPAPYNHTGRDIFCVNLEGRYVMDQEKRAGGLPTDGEMPRLIDASESIINNPDLWRVHTFE